MGSKNPLNKFRNRPNFSFRFNPNEEDLLEELTNSEATELEPVLSSVDDSKNTAQALISQEEDSSNANINNGSLSNSSSQSEVASQATTHSEKSSRDASPLKESVKDYLNRVGKRSASLDYVSTDGERWSLSGFKGRIAKRIEEITKDAPGFAGNLVRGSSFSGEKQLKLKESTSANGVNEQKSRDPSPVPTSLTSRSQSSLDVRTAVSLHDELAGTVGEKDRDRSISVEEGIDCAASGDQNGRTRSLSGELNALGMKKDINDHATSHKQNMSATTTKYIKGILEADSISLSALKATRSFDSEFLVADEMEDMSSWEILDSEHAVEEKPETPLVFEKKGFTDPATSEPIEPTTLSQQAWALLTTRHGNEIEVLKRPGVNNTVLSIMAAVLAVHLAPLSSYFTGLLTGFLLSYLVGRALFWFFRSNSHPKEPIKFPDYEKLPPLLIPVSDSGECDATISKGWMNQLIGSKYDPENYNVSQTHSVYVRLEGSQLRLSRPKVNISRRAMWNESKPNPVFIDQKHHKLLGATVTLPPEGLARKRLWSKKYPICLTILSNSSQTNFDEDRGSISYSDDEKSSSPTITLYIFARTCREKEEWYRRFYIASTGKPLTLYTSSDLHIPESSSFKDVLNSSTTEMTDFSNLPYNSSIGVNSSTEESFSPVNYASYMAKYVSQDSVLLQVPGAGTQNLGDAEQAQDRGDQWLNSLIGRIFYDFLTYPCWADIVADRIQRKLSVIKVPYFMDELKLKDINLGPNLPSMHRSSPPLMDQRGLWIDFDLTYKGTFQMTLETKLNLMRLKRDLQSINENTKDPSSPRSGEQEMETGELSPPPRHINKSYLYNSDEEDSAESSSDEELSTADSVAETSLNEEKAAVAASSVAATVGKASTSKKFLHWVDKITSSRSFQKATEFGMVKKAMEGVSKTPIVLTVDIKGLCGTLAINIPPPPTDRLWYGFRRNPQLSLTARPKLGDHVVTYTHITDWIEKKLTLEFQKVLVMPNMDDLVIPIMEPAYNFPPQNR